MSFYARSPRWQKECAPSEGARHRGLGELIEAPEWWIEGAESFSMSDVQHVAMHQLQQVAGANPEAAHDRVCESFDSYGLPWQGDPGDGPNRLH